MASLRRKPASKFWYACYTDATGVKRQRSTKEVNRSKAQRIADAFEEAYKIRATERQIRHVLSSIHEELHGKPLSGETLGQFLDGWLAEIRPEVAANTAKRYADAVAAAKVRIGDRPLHALERKDLVGLRNALAESKAPGTVNLYMSVVRAALQRAAGDGKILTNPGAQVPDLKEASDSGRRPFTMEELRAVLAVASGEWPDIIRASLFTAGQRLGDIALLRRRDIDLSKWLIRFRTRKSRRDMVLPAPAQLRPILARRCSELDANQYLFPAAAAKAGGPSGVSPLSADFSRLLWRAGLRDNPKHAKAEREGMRKVSALSFHSLRHTATSFLKSAGAPESVVMDLVGHDSDAVSRNYTHISDESKARALALLPEI